jgi:hypothetical protein
MNPSLAALWICVATAITGAGGIAFTVEGLEDREWRWFAFGLCLLGFAVAGVSVVGVVR